VRTRYAVSHLSHAPVAKNAYRRSIACVRSRHTAPVLRNGGTHAH